MAASTTLLSTVTLPEFTDLVKREWTETPSLVPMNAQRLFIVENLSYHSGDSKRYNEYDTETFALGKEEGTNAKKTRAGVGYEKDMKARRFAREIEITWEMRKWNKYTDVATRLISLAEFGPQRLELDLTHRLTFAGSTSYVDIDGVTVDTTTGDGLALVSASHTIPFGSTTYSNRVSGDPVFSQVALEAAELIAKNEIISLFGEKRVMNFNAIITGKDPATCRAVKQLLQSTADVDAIQSGLINTYKGSYVHIELDYLDTTASGANDSTKRRYWFLGAIGQQGRGWQAYLGIFEPNNLKTPAPGNNGEDVHNDNWTYGTRMSYGICIPNPRGIIGSLVTS